MGVTVHTLANVAGGAAAESTITAIAGETIPVNSLVYIRNDGKCALANATAEGKEAMGFVTSAHTAGETVTIKLPGNLFKNLSGLTSGATYYMSTTAGGYADAATAATYTTGNVVLAIGTAVSTTEILFSPRIAITL